MKRNAWISPLVSALFAFILAVSSVGNLITGYHLPVEAMWTIYVWCALAAIATAVLFQIPHGGKIMVGLAALAALGLCMAELLRPHIPEQFETLFYVITAHYNKVYNWKILGQLSATDVSVPLILWAVLVAFSANWYLCRRKHIAVAIIPAVIPLVVCLVTADRVPAAIYLYLLIMGLATLLITDWTRRTQPAQSMKLAILFVLPVALFLGLVFVCNPEAGYVNHASKLQKDLSVWFEDVQNTAESVLNGTPIDDSAGKRINLQAVGTKSKSTRSVMVVNSPIDGKLYLRERDYDVYTGTAWEASSERKETFPTGATPVGTLSILTYSTRSNLFVPYYATSGISLVGGALENENNLQQYRYEISQKISKKASTPGAQYKALPEETQAWATALANTITEGATTTTEKVFKIQNYVRSAAVYDTAAAKMDTSYNDFAQWFLEESGTGYCIHYATAATVLLRAAGISARYVEGFSVECTAGANVVVSKQQAHAWVEYYDQDTRAWCIMEATPISPEVEKPKTESNKPQQNVTVPGVIEVTPSEEEIPGDTPVKIPPKEEPLVEPTDPPEFPEPPEDPPADDLQVKEPWKMPKWMKIAIGCLLFIGCVILQGYLRILWKRKLWNRGAPNDLAIWRWRKTRAIAKLLGQYYPVELDEVALKARFSQHEIQPEELQQFEDFRLTLLDTIDDKPWYKRAFFKWILAIG